ncbi:protein kinase domain-containing protein [Solilutibacter silvestris]|uniref:protein kinase domain-containing protein n=1 Tax=Solilutibacter silvestris TaxID=1645665 RepID=UPI003D32C4C1
MPEILAEALRLFDHYVDMPVAERARALKQLKVVRPDLHEALAALLAADKGAQVLDAAFPAIRTGKTADDAEARRAAADARLGTLLGPWRIEETLATGGMGTIYRASRADGQYRQQVALKCIRAELSSPPLIAAFLSERNNLAHLDHPHIAMLIDGGIEDDGHPWFAMRHVEGEPIDQWCDERHAGLRERIGLLLQLCDAVGYAHRKLVLHQDIKPSNLLVAGDGQLQVIDFGLSSMLDEGARARRIAVSYGHVAPEVYRGGEPSVAIDIHAVGMVMYRLLCGEAPFPMRLPHVAKAPLVPVPMEKLAANASGSTVRASGHATADALAAELAGDLSAIAAKCVAADPAERYTSADDIAKDLRSYLAQRPIALRRDEPFYRFDRFLRRNRALVVVVALAVCLFVSGAAFFAWKQQHARAEVAATETVSRLFESTMGTAVLSGLGETRFSSMDLIARTEGQLRLLDLKAQPRVLARALSVLAKNYAVLGEYDRARRLAEEASTLVQGTDGPQIENAAVLASLLNAEAKHAEAGEVAAKGLRDLGDAAGAQTASPRLRLLNELAIAQWGMTNRTAALSTLDSAVAFARKTGDTEAVAALLSMRGFWLSRLYRRARAEQDLDEAIALSKDRDPTTGNEARIALVRTLIAMDRLKEAVAVAESLLQSRRRTLGEHHPETGRAWILLAHGQFFTGKEKESIDSLARGEKIIAATYGTRHPEYADALWTESNIDSTLRGDRETGLAKAGEALRILEATLGDSHDMTMRAKLNVANKLAAMSEDPKRIHAFKKEAVTLYEDLLRLGEVQRLPQPEARLFYASLLLDRYEGGDPEKARKLLEQCARDADAYFGPGDSYRFTVRYVRAKLAYRNKDYAEAERLFEGLLADAKDMRRAVSANVMTHNALRYLAFSAVLSGRKGEARAYLQQAAAADEKAFGKDHRITLGIERLLDELERTGTIQEAEDNRARPSQGTPAVPAAKSAR